MWADLTGGCKVGPPARVSGPRARRRSDLIGSRGSRLNRLAELVDGRVHDERGLRSSPLLRESRQEVIRLLGVVESGAVSTHAVADDQQCRWVCGGDTDPLQRG